MPPMPLLRPIGGGLHHAPLIGPLSAPHSLQSFAPGHNMDTPIGIKYCISTQKMHASSLNVAPIPHIMRFLHRFA
jgi:hypothetical protein